MLLFARVIHISVYKDLPSYNAYSQVQKLLFIYILGRLAVNYLFVSSYHCQRAFTSSKEYCGRVEWATSIFIIILYGVAYAVGYFEPIFKR